MAMEQALVELARHTPVQRFNHFVKRMCELHPQLKDQVRFSTMAELDELLAEEFDDVVSCFTTCWLSPRPLTCYSSLWSFGK